MSAAAWARRRGRGRGRSPSALLLEWMAHIRMSLDDVCDTSPRMWKRLNFMARGRGNEQQPAARCRPARLQARAGAGGGPAEGQRGAEGGRGGQSVTGGLRGAMQARSAGSGARWWVDGRCLRRRGGSSREAWPCPGLDAALNAGHCSTPRRDRPVGCWAAN